MLQLLDCSLRDGGYINDWQFGESEILFILKKLSAAKVDYIEAGFLNEVNYNSGSTNFSDISKAERVLNNISSSVELALMVRPDRFNSDKLCAAQGKIKYIRIAFYRKDLHEAIEFAQQAEAKGYKVFFNMVNTAGYTIEQLRETVTKLVEANPYAVTIVDTFGCMTLEKLTETVDVLNDILPSAVKMAFHPHNNMLMGYSLAQRFITLLELYHRDGIVDGTLMGIGRKPGNLPTELIAHHLNSLYGDKYNIGQLSSAIAKVIEPIKLKNDWGYSPAYMLGAAENINRNYIEYFLDNALPLDAIYEAAKAIPEKNAELFDSEVAGYVFNNALEKWKSNHCAFKLFYQYSAKQIFDETSVYEFRYAAGSLMASCISENILTAIDYVVPVPNTGIPYAEGFSAASGKKCISKLIKKNCDRTFYIENGMKRKNAIDAQLVLDDLAPDIKGKNIALIDEAIFSGITLKTVCKKLRQASVGNIFVLIPIGLWRRNCKYNELPAHKMLSEEVSYSDMANYIGADEIFIQDEEKLDELLKKYNYGICSSCFCD